MREVLLNGGVIHRLVSSFIDKKNSPGERDFILCINHLIEAVSNYAIQSKTTLAQEILDNIRVH